jgi:Nif-specific regulatory protein
MHNLKELASQVAVTDATVLISGESGTGKELFANLIKQRSNRRDKPFLTINCNTISDSLLESDLFGYEKGAFTDAQSMKKGKFEISDGGTIFLDEIGDISPRMQAVLLRVLQNGEIIRVGGNAPFKVDVRVIAATNRDLATEVTQGRFRLDLFYRLSVIKIHIPPLRERKEDLLDLTRHFVEKYCALFKRDNKLQPEKILDQLNSHHWPGNVRELENVIQRAILMCKDDSLFSSVLSFDTWEERKQSSKLSSVVREFNGTPLKNIVDHIEKEVILQKLLANGGNVAETAEKLNICKAALYEKMKRHDISAKGLR